MIIKALCNNDNICWYAIDLKTYRKKKEKKEKKVKKVLCCTILYIYKFFWDESITTTNKIIINKCLSLVSRLFFFVSKNTLMNKCFFFLTPPQLVPQGNANFKGQGRKAESVI